MATIEPLVLGRAVQQGVLERVPLPDWERRDAIRPLYATTEFLDSIEESITLHDPANSFRHRTLYKHLWQMFGDFRCSERPGAGDLKRIMPTKKGVWKMHPPKLRIYGWCPFEHSFVAVEWATEDQTKADKKLTDVMRQRVLDFIEKHRLQDAVLVGEYHETFPYK